MVHVKFYPVNADPFVSHYHSRRPVDWDREFRTTAPLDLEIGFGMGEFLTRTARDDPGRRLVGIENDWVRIKKTLRRIERINRYAAGDGRLDNIRVLQVDARVALERLFRPRSVARVFCLFPCPWPKKRHVKHRLFSRDFLRLVNSRLERGGYLRIVTDHAPYKEWIEAQNRRTGLRLESRRIRPGYDTKYERKWVAAGQKIFFELLLRKRRHINIPLIEDAALKRYFLPDFPGADFRFQDRTGDEAVIFKKIIFDRRRKAGMLHLVVAEKNLTQHVWIQVTARRRGWEIAVAEGQAVLPTRGVARALHEVYAQSRRQLG